MHNRFRAERWAHQSNRILLSAGLDLQQLRRSAKGLLRFRRDWVAYREACTALGLQPPRPADLYPVLSDRTEQSGAASGHYFHQDLWVARKVYAASPASHIDIGSRIDGFVAHLLAFRAITVVDIRELRSTVPGLTFVQADATSLDGLPTGAFPSVSSLHAIEHFGLGRYGDPIDPLGWRAALAAISRITSPGGRIYIGVPVGRERTMFNGHRIFRPSTIIETLAPSADLVDFAAVGDDGQFLPDAAPNEAERFDYGCGLFEFERHESSPAPPKTG